MSDPILFGHLVMARKAICNLCTWSIQHLLSGVLGVFDLGGLGRLTEKRRSGGRGAGTILASSPCVSRHDLGVSDFDSKPKLYRGHGRIRTQGATRSVFRHGSLGAGGTHLYQAVLMQFRGAGEHEG